MAEQKKKPVRSRGTGFRESGDVLSPRFVLVYGLSRYVAVVTALRQRGVIRPRLAAFADSAARRARVRRMVRIAFVGAAIHAGSRHGSSVGAFGRRDAVRTSLR